MPNQMSPILFMLSSTFSLSLTGLLSKYLSQYLDANLLSLLRFAVPAFIILFFFTRTPVRRPSQREFMPLWIRALCIGACQVCFIYSLKHLTLVESVVLFGTGPLFIPLLEKLLFSVRLSTVNVVTLLLTFVGVVLLAGDTSGFHFRFELLIGLAAGLFNAGSQLSLYRISQSQLNPFEINLWTFAFAALLITPLVGLSLVQQRELMSVPANQFGLMSGLIVVLAMLIINTQVFRSKAYKLSESGSQLAPLIFTNLLFTALWQGLFYDAYYHSFQLLGLTLIIVANVGGVVLPKWSQIRRASTPT